MVDQNDRYKFEWLDDSSERDRNIRIGIRVVLVTAFVLFAALAICLI